MRNVRLPVLLLLTIGVFWAAGPIEVVADRDEEKVTLEDDCDPTNVAPAPNGWGPTGCPREEGTVTRPEFDQFLASPLSLAVVGHPSWKISPANLSIGIGDTIRVKNTGGRGHTFTRVADYGAGFVPPPGGTALNRGLTLGDCAGQQGTVIPPGGRGEVAGLTPGVHKFQCCIHPWMRSVVRVE